MFLPGSFSRDGMADLRTGLLATLLAAVALTYLWLHPLLVADPGRPGIAERSDALRRRSGLPFSFNEAPPARRSRAAASRLEARSAKQRQESRRGENLPGGRYSP